MPEDVSAGSEEPEAVDLVAAAVVFALAALLELLAAAVLEAAFFGVEVERTAGLLAPAVSDRAGSWESAAWVRRNRRGMRRMLNEEGVRS